MAGTRFVVNQPGFRSMANGPEMVQLTDAVADATKAAAESIAPRETGRYADSFRVEKNKRITIAGYERASAEVHNDAPYAVAVEYGSGGRRVGPGRSGAHRTLARALGLVSGA